MVGNIKSGVEAITGYDPITGRKLESWERAVSAVGIVGGPAAKAVKHGGKLAVKGGKFLQQQGSKLAQQGGKLVEKGGNLLGKVADVLDSSRTQLAGAEAGLGKFSFSTGISAGKKTGTSGSKQVGNLPSSSSGKDKGYVASKGTGNLTRKEALNKAKDLAGVPSSQQPTRQWQVGDDITKKGADYKNYEYSSNPTHHGRYYEYDTPHGKRVIVEHTNDGRPHTHAGKPKEGANPFEYDFKKERYSNIYGPNGDHHIYYDK